MTIVSLVPVVPIPVAAPSLVVVAASHLAADPTQVVVAASHLAADPTQVVVASRLAAVPIPAVGARLRLT